MGGNEVTVVEQKYEAVSPADFFYRNRDIAGFSNPVRALYSAIRELVENSLDACEIVRTPPDIYITLTEVEKTETGSSIYRIRVEDNGCGVPEEHIPSCFGRVFFGSKYTLKQTRGTFGLGGTMAILYGQITTHKPVKVMSSTDGVNIHFFELMIDIQSNKPIILKKASMKSKGWRGTIVELHLEGDYPRAASRIVEYLRQTAMVNPHANIVFIDPRGRLYFFERATTKVPRPPREVKPHPHGVDVETMRRMIATTKCDNMLDFIVTHFHRVGKATAKKFLKFAGISPRKNPKKMTPDDIVKLVRAARTFNDFLRPDASCLSPIGAKLLEVGIRKELKLGPDAFLMAHQRKPSAYSGYPFIVEVAIAYGEGVPKKEGGFTLYRFANKIPLLYDEASDVSWKVVNKVINWSTYKVTQDMPILIVTHICSTKIPYKTVGKEFVADRPEIEHEIEQAIRYVARHLRLYISRQRRMEREKKRLGVYSKYLPRIARYSAHLAGRPKPPDVGVLLKEVSSFE